jgi:hypothetical protein
MGSYEWPGLWGNGHHARLAFGEPGTTRCMPHMHNFHLVNAYPQKILYGYFLTILT